MLAFPLEPATYNLMGINKTPKRAKTITYQTKISILLNLLQEKCTRGNISYLADTNTNHEICLPVYPQSRGALKANLEFFYRAPVPLANSATDHSLES